MLKIIEFIMPGTFVCKSSEESVIKRRSDLFTRGCVNCR